MLTEGQMIRGLNRAGVDAREAARTLDEVQRWIKYSEDVSDEELQEYMEHAQWRLQDAVNELQELTGVHTSP